MNIHNGRKRCFFCPIFSHLFVKMVVRSGPSGRKGPLDSEPIRSLFSSGFHSTVCFLTVLTEVSPPSLVRASISVSTPNRWSQSCRGSNRRPSKTVSFLLKNKSHHVTTRSRESQHHVFRFDLSPACLLEPEGSFYFLDFR